MKIEDSTFLFEAAGERLVGIVTKPAPDAAAGTSALGVLVVVGGPQYRVGSHRQFVLLARALAARGHAVMRFDCAGMGDSTGSERSFTDREGDLRAAIDAFVAHVPAVSDVVVWGLCDAASAALLYAPDDPRVKHLVLLNPWVRSDAGLARTHLKHYYGSRLADRAFWIDVMRGRVGVLRALREFLATMLAARGRPNGAEAPAGATPDFQARMARGWRRFGGDILLICSGDDLTAREFVDHAASDAEWAGLVAQSRVVRCDLADADHTFSRAEWRDRVAQLTADWLDERGDPVAGGAAQDRPEHRRRRAAGRCMTAGLRRLLMVAYHFPPLRGSSGIQRTLRFVQHLPKFGWEPLVLTASARAYEETSDDQLREIPDGTVVERAFALNTARDLSLFGRYPGALALPDRWSTWRLGAVPRGLKMIRRYRPDAIWSTYPIATAHVIGSTLARRSGLPWIADFRDPMAQDGYPADPRAWRAYRAIEEDALRRAAVSVFTTPGCAALYHDRYPDIAGAKSVVIENGYDEDTFARAEAGRGDDAPVEATGRFVLLHSGVVYPDERDPRPLIAALGVLKRSGALTAANFCLRLRASGYDPMLAALASEHDVADLVSLEPAIPYHAALREMLRVDGLLILQASNCNQQIPAKLYEYLRARRPVLALTDPVGDTATTLRAAGLSSIARLDDVAAIVEALPAFIDRARSGREAVATPDAVADSSREGRARAFAGLLDRTIAIGSR